jgi:hypothetical protein
VTQPAPTTTPLPAKPRLSPPQKLDAWAALHPWHPRFLPFIVYVVFLSLSKLVADSKPTDPALLNITHVAAPLLYLVGAVLVAWLIHRYRALTPELNWKFHWLAVPLAVLSVAAWIVLGRLMAQAWPARFDGPVADPLAESGPLLGWTGLVLRVMGMALVVPMFEELAIRSAVLRSFNTWHDAKTALLQLVSDLPLLGDLVMNTEASRQADRVKQPLAAAFHRTAFEDITIFGILASSLLWCPISHTMRDWPGTIVCGVLWGLLLRYTNRNGRSLALGPVIWTHALTNALLWAWVVYYGDWRFL